MHPFLSKCVLHMISMRVPLRWKIIVMLFVRPTDEIVHKEMVLKFVPNHLVIEIWKSPYHFVILREGIKLKIKIKGLTEPICNPNCVHKKRLFSKKRKFIFSSYRKISPIFETTVYNTRCAVRVFRKAFWSFSCTEHFQFEVIEEAVRFSFVFSNKARLLEQ